MLAYPRRKILGAAFFEGGFLDQFREDEIAVELDEGIEIQNRNSDSRYHHDFVGPVMYGHTGCGSPPYDGSDEAKHQIEPDAGKRGYDARPAAAKDPDLGRVAEESGREIHQHETHLLGGCGIMFNRQTM